MDGDVEARVMAAVKLTAERGDPPPVAAIEVARFARETDLARILVSNLCFAHNSPVLWKLIDGALGSRVLSPLLTLALITTRVIPHRREKPEAYRLYLELLSRHAFSSSSVDSGACRDMITKSVDDALQLSHTYGILKMDFGHAVAFFVLSVVTRLIDATLEDWGLESFATNKHGSINASEGHQVMDIDSRGTLEDKRHEHREQLRRDNSLKAIEMVEKAIANKRNRVFLRLILLNMPEKFNGLLQRLQFIEAHKSRSPVIISVNHLLEKLHVNIQKVVDGEYRLDKRQLLGVLVGAGSCGSSSCHSSGAGRAACWIPFDIFMENAMDGKFLHAISSVEILTELTKTLQVINQASWQETFQALWISALRLIQRDREPWEGPIPHLEARLCMLLSIVPLAIVPLLKEESKMPSILNSDITGRPRAGYEHGMEGNKSFPGRHGLVSSLQVLGQFTGLLSPPPSVLNAANKAATKAAAFISIFKSGSGNLHVNGHNVASVKAVGNMLHLIIEACIARNLIDTSVYLWPGYVIPSSSSKDSALAQDSPWSSFMEGAQFTGSLKNALILTPASSIVELEKLYHIALNGSEEEKAAAAQILCGASLVRGWNIQEHTVHIVVKLLSPPLPPDFKGHGTGSHLIGYMPMLSAILYGISGVDIVHIVSLYGMVPEVAAALMPLCEVFGSLLPPSNYRSSTSDETSIYTIFSCAFLFLLRLWKFYKPPQEHCIAGRGGTVRVELTLDYLLLMRNSRIALQYPIAPDQTCNVTSPRNPSPGQPVYIDSFPRLRAWYFQNQACIASTLSGLCNKSPVYQVANKILNMICRKMTKVGTVSGNPSNTSSSSMSGSPRNSADDAYHRPMLPAWELLEAIPFVLEAVLSACAHGRLSSRDLTTALRDLVDFLPASLATIISYFSAEITRGIWKPVVMNGTDWPSPAANLLSIESEIKEILASAGVDVPSCYACGMTPLLPLPMAALVSLTITFKLDKSLEYVHGVISQALENCSTGCSWPNMPIIGALWSQKIRRWHDYIVLSCARFPFARDQEAVAQLIRSCFSAFLGGSHLRGGVNALLGEAISDQGFRLPIAPGFLYLRSCRTFHDTHFVNNAILGLVVGWARSVTSQWGSARLPSLAAAAASVRDAATLGASLMCIAGGMELVQVLYEETIPTSLLSAREVKPASSILEGYAMAYMLVLSGAFVWGVGSTSPAFYSAFSSRRLRVMRTHMDFVAAVTEGDLAAMGCGPEMWKAYVSCLAGLMVSFVPAWVAEVELDTLRKLAAALTGWRQCHLAMSLLELGGPAAFLDVANSVL